MPSAHARTALSLPGRSEAVLRHRAHRFRSVRITEFPLPPFPTSNLAPTVPTHRSSTFLHRAAFQRAQMMSNTATQDTERDTAGTRSWCRLRVQGQHFRCMPLHWFPHARVSGGRIDHRVVLETRHRSTRCRELGADWFVALEWAPRHPTSVRPPNRHPQSESSAPHEHEGHGRPVRRCRRKVERAMSDPDTEVPV
jgi:hypothetical protein